MQEKFASMHCRKHQKETHLLTAKKNIDILRLERRSLASSQAQAVEERTPLASL
jgi:hypothetical protein